MTICAALIERVNTAATAVDTHHADLVRIRAAIAQLREQWTTVRSALESLLLQELFAPSWRTPVTAPSATAPPINIGGFTMLSAAEAAQQRQAKIDSYEQDLTDLQTTWQGLVDEQETSAASCRAALDNAASGGWTYIVGTGIARAELGTALGLDALLFDDRERARVAALTIPGQGWDELSPQEQAFYRGLAASEFSTPLVLGSTSMIPDLWSDLDPLAQQALIHDQSSMIGNLDGIPADARDQANRITLDTFLSDARSDVLAAGASLPGSDVNPHGAGQAEQIESALRAAGYSDEQIKAVRGAMEVQYQLDTRIPSRATLPDALPVELLIFDPEAYGGKGRAAISIGDVATAENVAMLVPGMTSEVPGYMDSQTGDALNLYERSSLFSDSTAVVAYVGYDAPGIDLGVTGQDKSDAGGKVVAADISGLHAMTQAPDGRLTVIAHSYGSTTTATAFADNGASADNLVLIGSPGAGRADTAAEITGVPAGHVFVGSASSDPVTTIVQQAQDPNQAGLTGLKAGWHFGSEVGGAGRTPTSRSASSVPSAGWWSPTRRRITSSPTWVSTRRVHSSAASGSTPRPRTTASTNSAIIPSTTGPAPSHCRTSPRSPSAVTAMSASRRLVPRTGCITRAMIPKPTTHRRRRNDRPSGITSISPCRWRGCHHRGAHGDRLVPGIDHRRRSDDEPARPDRSHPGEDRHHQGRAGDPRPAQCGGSGDDNRCGSMALV